MVDVTHVLSEKYKGMEWTLHGDALTEEEFNDGFTITKANGVEEPTWAKLQEHLTSMQAEYDALDYSRKRKEAYDKINQLELISDDSINGTTTHKDAILKVKSDYPKPE
tara:strand:- start:360 stop:686 length:327 start_codon:yes stop_codon:yes gene_type:complete